MADPTDTKVEQVIEAFESFVVAIVAATANHTKGNHQNVLDARKESFDALKAFLQPVLRRVQ